MLLCQGNWCLGLFCTCMLMPGGVFVVSHILEQDLVLTSFLREYHNLYIRSFYTLELFVSKL